MRASQTVRLKAAVSRDVSDETRGSMRSEALKVSATVTPMSAEDTLFLALMTCGHVK